MEEDIKNDLAGIAFSHPFFSDIVTGVLNYIKKLEAEIESQDKTIDNLIEEQEEREKYVHSLEEENKELELEKESYKHDYFDIYERTKRYIKEEDVIELQEKIHKDLDKNGITRAYQIIIDKYFNKLLGEY